MLCHLRSPYLGQLIFFMIMVLVWQHLPARRASLLETAAKHACSVVCVSHFASMETLRPGVKGHSGDPQLCNHHRHSLQDSTSPTRAPPPPQSVPPSPLIIRRAQAQAQLKLFLLTAIIKVCCQLEGDSLFLLFWCQINIFIRVVIL